MRVLHFVVDSQTLKKDGDFSNIVSGSKGYLACEFSLSDRDWSDALKIALFDNKIPIKMGRDNVCYVPDEVTDGRSFKLRLVGKKGLSIITTNNVLVEQVVYNGS